MLQQQNKGGYKYKLTDDNGRKLSPYVASLVIRAFIGEKPDESLTIDHINRVRDGNGLVTRGICDT